MNKNFIFLIILLPIIFSSCAKQKSPSPLANNYLEQAKIEASEENYRKALQLVNKSIEISPNPQALALKATLLYQLQEFHESVAVFKKIIKSKDTPSQLKADVMNNYACALLSLGNKNEAKIVWHQLILNKNYLSPELAWFNLGLIDFQEALPKKFENKVEFHVIMEKALYNFSNAIEINPEYVDAYFYIGLILMHLERWQDSEKIFTKLLKIAPEHKVAKEAVEIVRKSINR